jgi:glycogen(starch) synthase
MRILMLGWEFPPYISGGLGTACLGLTGALMRRKARVLFVLPRAIGTGEDTEIEDEQREYADTDALRVAAIPSELTSPYPAFTTNRPPETAEKVPSRTKRRGGQQADQPEASVRVVGVGSGDGYDGDLVAKIRRYTERCMRMTRREIFDVIHAHDWMTFPAGEQIAHCPRSRDRI